MKKLILLLIMMLGLGLPLAQDALKDRATGKPGYIVIVSEESDLHRISLSDIQHIYLGKKTLWENELRIEPVMLWEEQVAMNGFIEDVLQKTVGQYRAYWKRRLFSGGGTVPKTFKSQQALLSHLRARPGAIAILPAQAVPEGVRIVELRK